MMTRIARVVVEIAKSGNFGSSSVSRHTEGPKRDDETRENNETRERT
jgi:hypothetical protein